MGVVKSITCTSGRITSATGGTVDTIDITDDAVTLAKLQNIATARLLGRSTAGTGDVEQITIGTGLSLSGGVLSSVSGSGSVTSVGLSAPGIFTVSGSPVTTSGTLELTLASQTQNLVWASPDGSSGAPTFRVLVNADFPYQGIGVEKIKAYAPQRILGTRDGSGDQAVETLELSGLSVSVSGVLSPDFPPATTTANQVYAGPTSGPNATPDFRALVTADLPTGIPLANLATLSAGVLLGRTSASTGTPQEITIGSGLSLSGTTLTATAGSGTVTSVALSLPGIFTVTGSPVTTSGTLTAALASQTANLVWASPDGSSGAPTFRALVAADLATGIISTTKLADAAVTTVKVADANITTAKIADANITTAKIADGAVTSTKLASGAAQANIANGSLTLNQITTLSANRLLGNPGGITANVSEITLGSNLSFSGGALVVSAVTSVGLSLPNSVFTVVGGAITATGTLTANFATQTANTLFAGPTTGAAAAPTFRTMVAADVPDNLISDAKIRQSAGLSVLGRSANTTGNVADITAGTDNQVLRRSGTTLDFGAINLASTNAVTGTLAAANGGTGQSSYTTGDLLYASGTTALSKLAVGSASQVLGVSGGAPAWRDEYAVTNSESVLGSAYTVASTSFADTGLNVTLPAAGTYLVIAECRGNVNMTTGLGGVAIELYNTTDSAAIANTERTCILANGTQAQGTGTVTAVVTVAASKTIRVNAKRIGAGTFSASTLESNTGGRSALKYIRLY